MSYQALYRVWRPQTFDDMVGQPVIKETLKNAVKSNHISHAYLFTGPRGTGKTSSAKIFAKAINCEHQVDGNPCNACDICRLITDGQLPDVVEIDAASNNGVDEIRDLRDNVRYAPTQARYKVYIIDEVHMLTTGAFNALLKTLEEPPEQVVFILATTEPHKIPATILSRTQRFDFKRMTDNDLIGRMQEILDHDQIDYDEEALAIIARAANGGMRDSLSLLDQAISYNTEEVTIETALEVSGSLSQLALATYIQHLHANETEEALAVVKAQFEQGKQAARFIDELILFARDMLLTRHIKTNQTLLTDKEIQPLMETVPTDFYYQLIDTLNETQGKMRFTTQPDLYIEVMTIQLAQAMTVRTEGETQGLASSPKGSGMDSALIQTLQANIQQLEAQVAMLSQQVKGQDLRLDALKENVAVGNISENDTQSVSSPTPIEKTTPKVPRPRPDRQSTVYQLHVNDVYRVLNEATHTHIRIVKAAWSRILDDLTPQDRAKFIDTEPLAAGPGGLLVSFKGDAYAGLIQNDRRLLQLIEKAVAEQVHQSMRFVIVLAKEWSSLRSNYAVLRKNNGNNPITIEDSDVPQPDSAVQPDMNVESEPESNEEDKPADITDTANQSDPSVVEVQPPILTSSETTPMAEDPSQTDLAAENAIPPLSDADALAMASGMMAAEPVEEEEGVAPIVQHAIELFGEENVIIHYDK